MHDVECILLSNTSISNEIGVENNEAIQRKIPIIKIEDIYANEYYEANQAGHQPTLRLRISALNYNFETELIYMGKTYTIIRTDEPCIDETVLICERKIKNV